MDDVLNKHSEKLNFLANKFWPKSEALDKAEREREAGARVVRGGDRGGRDGGGDAIGGGWGTSYWTAAEAGPGGGREGGRCKKLACHLRYC